MILNSYFPQFSRELWLIETFIQLPTCLTKVVSLYSNKDYAQMHVLNSKVL